VRLPMDDEGNKRPVSVVSIPFAPNHASVMRKTSTVTGDALLVSRRAPQSGPNYRSKPAGQSYCAIRCSSALAVSAAASCKY
jgi:hypothetical protein